MFLNKNIKSQTKLNAHKFLTGFTLIELLVTISIFVIISSVMFFSFPTFGSRTVLNNLAHEIALAVRQAQVFGISVREFTPGEFPHYGIFFNTSNNAEFVLFADLNKNDLYDETSGELAERFVIRKGNYVSRLCGFSLPTSPCSPLNELYVTFERPNPEATIKDGVGLEYSYAQISVRSPRGDTRTITVWSNGQIAVE